MIERRPRAPVPRSKAWSAISSNASGSNSSSTPSRLKSRWYCLTKAFLGSVSTATRAARSSLETEVNTGNRPMNSGIMPNLRRSSGITWEKMSSGLVSLASTRSPSTMSKVKPTRFCPSRCSMMWSRPEKAPPTMNSWSGSQVMPRFARRCAASARRNCGEPFGSP